MIFKRQGSPFYSYRFMLQGNVYQASTKQSNFKIAKEIETTRRSEISRGKCGIFDKKPSPTLADFCTRVFEPRISATVGGPIRKKTWDDFYKVGINALRGYPQLANAPLDEIGSDLIGRFAAERRKEGKAISTVNSSLRVLRRILNKAVDWHNPEKGAFFLEKVPEIALLKGENHRERVLTAREENAYLEKAKPGSLLGDFATVLFDTAMRPEEAYRLRWESLAWEGGLHGDSTLRVFHGKTDNARRELPMSPRVGTLLKFRWEAAEKPQEGYVLARSDRLRSHGALYNQETPCPRVQRKRD